LWLPAAQAMTHTAWTVTTMVFPVSHCPDIREIVELL
jgi:hypothetical protein